MQRLRVPSGFLLLAAFVCFARPNWESMAWGMPMALCGLGLRAWAAGHLAKNQNLTTSGPYAWMRNPLYGGTLLTAAGVVLAARQTGLAILFVAVFVLVYLPVIQLEEQKLRELFPRFARYADAVPVLLPLNGPWREAAQTRFRWALYVRNKEYKAALGFLVAVAWLLMRVLVR
jgi:protein-S-isoprenylcysteine O-methyltransferase Ste14